MQSTTLMYHRGGKDFRAPTVSSSTSTSSATTTHSATSTTNMRPPPPPPPTTKAHLKDVSNAKEPQPRSAEEPSSSIPDLEFDGTTVLCRVCGDKASGFHYGVHSCEGCKGFFRRSIQQKIQYRPCTKNQQCSILRINRNRCQYCRLKKCIAVGMSRDAVRFGRVPKREKARILAAMQQSSNSRSLEKAVAAELEDDQRLLATVVRAHLDTCDFTREKVEPMLQRARDQPSYTACPPTLACPLNPNPQPLTGQQELLQDFSKRFSPAIRGVVEFAKRIPGFSLLAQDDQVTLLKAGVFEVLLVRLACMFDAHTSSMVCLNGQVLRRDSIHNSSNARFLMDSMFDFAERVNALRLSDAEIGLFCSVVVIAADRPGLRNTELIERMHSKLRNALHSVMAQNRPGQPDACHELMKKIPDLRTLNTLHSEKLLAFKMTEQQQQLQQQQLNGHQQWSATVTSHHPQTHHEDDSKSPAASSWSSGSDVTIDEAKSPLGSVSSTESVCSAEISASVAAASISSIDYHHHHTLAPQHHQHQQHHQQAPSQHASSAPLLAATLAGSLCPHRHRANSGSSGDDELAAAAHLVHNGLTITPVRSHHQHHQMTRTFRKLDSPSDSGIESGAENRQDRLAPGSAPTSLCSSPRSSLEDHTDDHHKTSMSGSSSSRSVEDMPVLKRVLQAPPLYDTNSLMDEAYKPHKKFRALRNAKDSAEAEPAVHPQYPTPAASVSPISIPPQTQPTTMTHLSAALTQSQPQQSSLSSTHSTLAKSLMEGPRMTAEQMKRTDIIHNYIMGGSLLVCASPTQNYQQQQQQSPHHQSHSPQPQYPQVSWPSNGCSTPPVAYGTSVITTTQATCRQSQPAYVLVSNSPQPSPGDVPRIYFHPQSPAHSTSASPTPPQHHQHIKSPPVSPSSSMTKQLVELQVDIADSQQPLNLSKKSPSPSPRLKLEAA